MEKLNYSLLRGQGYPGFLLEQAPERVLQFGEGNFLRAFVDYFIDILNEKLDFNTKVTVVQPIAEGLADTINAQQGLYTVYLRGFENGEPVTRKRIVSSISRAINPYRDYQALLDCAGNPDLRFIVSNTTEAGIVFDAQSTYSQQPPASFPAKLTRFLHERFRRFGGQPGKGFVIISCELIDHNGDELKRCVQEYIRLWQLDDAFARWVDVENIFCSTLVDRIVTGYPQAEAAAFNAENGYVDALLDTGEIFAVWVIEGPKRLETELPFAKAGLPVIIADDCSYYKKRKVRILNGVQTGMDLASYLSGYDIVRFCMDDAAIGPFMYKTIHEEIIPALDLDKADMDSFAASVFERLRNPFIDHSLLAISLNTTAKWKARVLPTVKDYVQKFGHLPERLTFTFATYLAFYQCEKYEDGALFGRRGDELYPVRDDPYVLEFFRDHRSDSTRELVHAVCTNKQMWGEDLSLLPGFETQVAIWLDDIRARGMHTVLAGLA